MTNTRILICGVITLSILFLPLLNSAYSQGNTRLVLHNARIVDVINGYVSDASTIIIDGGIIDSIIYDSSVFTFENAVTIDMEGKFLIPGLFDAHVHISSSPEISLEIALKHGITGIRDMGGDGGYLKMLQETIESGELNAPDIYFSAIMGGPELINRDTRIKLSTPEEYELGEAPWARLVAEGSDIADIIGDAKECGATGIKMYSHLSAVQINELSVEAKKQGLKVWSHSFIYPATTKDAVSAGVEVISHANGLLFNADWNLKKDGSLAMKPEILHSEELAQLLEQMTVQGTMLDPTFSVAEYMLNPIEDQKNADKLRNLLSDVTRLAFNKGVAIVAGTDCPLPKDESGRLRLYNELETLTNQVGMPPVDALRAATINCAKMLGIEKSHGSLEEGKTANIVVIAGNPLADIRAIKEVYFVIKKL